MQEVERPSRPVLFLAKESEYPYWGRGSSLFVASDRNVYWLTARHVIERQGASAPDLIVTPTDDSAITVPFNELIQIARDPDNPDYKDLFMLRINLEEFWGSTDSELYAWNIDRNFFDCSQLSQGDELFVLGFPSESRFVDYETKRVHFTKVVLRGVYEGLSSEEHCHKLRLETSVDLKELDGLSGGTVFRHPRNPNEPSEFVGLVVRGTAVSGFVYFIDCAVIADFVRLSDAA
jgi:hypothetical protein